MLQGSARQRNSRRGGAKVGHQQIWDLGTSSAAAARGPLHLTGVGVAARPHWTLW